LVDFACELVEEHELAHLARRRGVVLAAVDQLRDALLQQALLAPHLGEQLI